jgi:nicotinate-nucleotide adenylyltransferase
VTLGLLFGSFDPIHHGHLAIAEWALDEGCDEVWLVVQSENAYKSGQAVASLEDRVTMAGLATADDPRLSVLVADAQMPREHIITRTLQALTGPRRRLKLILGEDLATSLPDWPDYGPIGDICTILTHPRFDAISSGQIRAQPTDHAHKLPRDVMEFIEVNHLY